MKKLSKNIYAGLLCIGFLITSPMITMQVLKESPDVRADSIEPDSQPDTLDETESETEELPTEFQFDESDESTTELQEIQLEFVESDASYFDDALFIGDSRMVGIRDYGTLNNASYLCSVGLSTYKVTDNKAVEGMTLSGKCSGNDYKKVYIMLGINEAADTPEAYQTRLLQLIEEVKQNAPDALIFLMANLHVTQQSSISSPSTGNERLNALNEAMEEIADGKSIFYLDVNPLFDDENHCLPADASGDGIHLYASYYESWCEWLCQHTITEQSRIQAFPSLHFGQAVAELRKGKHVSRKSWGNQNIYVQVAVYPEGVSIEMKSDDDKTSTWSASQEDMLAEDWYLVQEEVS